MNYNILPNSLVVNYDGKTFTVAKNDHRFKKVVELIKSGDFDKVKGVVENNFEFGADFRLEDGQLLYKDSKLPQSLSDRVLAFMKDGLPFEYLIKFFEKLNKNSSYNSRQMMYKFLEHNGHPITPEGNFIAYRGVTNDFKDRHTRTFDNSVGSVCEMPRDEVDDNPNNTCSSGLHVACHSYANGFGSQLVEVEVDPQDVVCVPTDYSGTKMRVAKFKVLNVCEQIREESVYNQDSVRDGSSLIGRAARADCGEYGEITDYDCDDETYLIEYDDGSGHDWIELDGLELL